MMKEKSEKKENQLIKKMKTKDVLELARNVRDGSLRLSPSRTGMLMEEEAKRLTPYLPFEELCS
jgi:hypothetical protein